jgi:hypothetical protein
MIMGENEFTEHYVREVTVPAGRYALPNCNGSLEFYEVDPYGFVTEVSGFQTGLSEDNRSTTIVVTNERWITDPIDAELVLLRIMTAYNAT